MQNRLKFLLKEPVFILSVSIFIVLVGWWYYLQPFNLSDSLLHSKYIWGSLYQILALIGGIYGIFQSKKWGGINSFLGRSILLFSLGLIFQCIGQSVYSYYNLYAQVEAPYPSLGDFGYFGSVILYILGVLSLARVSGVKISSTSFFNKFQAFIIPLVLLVLSYFIFLQGYQFDFSNKIKIFLDFGYPLGQAFYVSIAILILIMSRKFLGGLMKLPIILFLFALIVQYASDFNFLYSANNNTWHVGGIGDFLYMFSYLCMTMSIVFVIQTFKHIEGNDTNNLPQ